MVAYSFQRGFVNPIRLGLGLEPLPDFPPAHGPKRHTIRADRKRGHVREGQEIQLYYAMRTKHCMLIGRSPVALTCPIKLVFDDDDPEQGEGVISPGFGIMEWGYASLDAFAVGDGFENWAALKAFWRKEHPGVDMFDGTIIFWRGDQ